MNAASIVVLALVIVFAVLAVWRNLKKGAPCECGGSSKARCSTCECHCNDCK